MPKNRVLYLGVLVVAASALIWIGAELSRRIVWIVPYAAGVGVLLLVLGMVQEARKDRGAASPKPGARDGS